MFSYSNLGPWHWRHTNHVVFSYSTHTCNLHAAQDFQLNHFKSTTLKRRDALKFVTNLAPSVVSGHFIKYSLTINILNITFFHQQQSYKPPLNYEWCCHWNLLSSTHSTFINYISHANSFSYWHMSLWWYSTVLLLVSYLSGVFCCYLITLCENDYNC